MVSGLTEEFQAEGFYGEDWFKSVGPVDRSSDWMIKLITLGIQELLLAVALHPSMLWRCPLCAVRSWGRGGVLASLSSGTLAGLSQHV